LACPTTVKLNSELGTFGIPMTRGRSIRPMGALQKRGTEEKRGNGGKRETKEGTNTKRKKGQMENHGIGLHGGMCFARTRGGPTPGPYHSRSESAPRVLDSGRGGLKLTSIGQVTQVHKRGNKDQRFSLSRAVDRQLPSLKLPTPNLLKKDRGGKKEGSLITRQRKNSLMGQEAEPLLEINGGGKNLQFFHHEICGVVGVKNRKQNRSGGKHSNHFCKKRFP